MILHPYAKINLGLHVLGKRHDGFHEIQTLFYPVTDLHDTLEITAAKDFEIKIDKCTWDIQKDLCAKAFYLMHERYGISGAKIHLQKSIPSGAGLGGGSSDCAFTLKGLNELYGLELDTPTLERIAGELGSDCAFFIKCTPQWGSGKGEILSEAPDFLKGCHIRVQIPDGVSVNTAQAYRGIHLREHVEPLRQILELPMDQWREKLHNDFEESVFAEHPEIAELKEKMYTDGAIYASMSGSGAAVFGIFR